MKYALLILMSLLTAVVYADEINDLASALDSKKGVCADLSFERTRELLMEARDAQRRGRYDLADEVMADAYAAYRSEEAAYITLLGEAGNLRSKLVNLKTASADMQNDTLKKSLESGIRSAEIKLNFCDVPGARNLIDELENIK